jgi:two-component sensor histidine kinase/PAS domain-containing protein
MEKKLKNIFIILILSAISILLYYLSRKNYLLFHAIVKIYSIIIAAGIFFVSWNSRKHSENQNLVFLGIAYFFVGLIDFFHVLSYKGMNIFTDYSYYGNQLWICARMIESISLFVFIILGIRKIRFSYQSVFVGFSIITALCFLTVYHWKIFPVCFIDNVGQTGFKIAFEYIICFILLISLILIIKNKKRYDKDLFMKISLSIVFTIASEFSFTLYTDNYGVTSVIGHLFKVLSFYLIYQSIIVNTLQRPFDILYTELNKTRAILQAAMDQSSAGIAIADAPDGNIRYYNHAVLSMLGEVKENIPSGTGNIKHSFNWSAYNTDGSKLKYEDIPLLKAIKTGETDSREMVIGIGSDKKHIVLVNSAPIKNNSGNITGGIMVLQDISKLKLAEERVMILLNEKKLLLKEIHHRIKNNMNTVLSLLSMQSDAHDNPAIKNILCDAASRVESMSVLYDKLYRSENEDSLSLKDFLPSLVKEITGIFYNSKTVNIKTDIEDIILSAKTLSSLGIMVNELITNSMKYAFTGMDEGIIDISAFRQENSVTIVYKDNGVGIPESLTFENSTGFGMQLVSLLAGQLNASIKIEKDCGTKITIVFDV